MKQWFISRNQVVVFIVFFIGFLFSLIFMEDGTSAAAKESPELYDKDVLIVQSYNRDYVHTRELEKGIEEVFGESNVKVRLRYEFMDTKNYVNKGYFDQLYEIYRNKYKDITFDAIILCDNDALNFYQTYGKTLWPDTNNVIATGINSISGYPDGVEGVVIIEERFEYKKNIELALEQNKAHQIKRLNFIYDDTTTSNEIRRDLETLTREQYSSYEINHYYDKTPEELKEIIDTGTEQDLFFFVIYFHSMDGRTFTHDEVPKYLFQNTANPVYGFIEFYLNTGIVGGYMISSSEYGEEAAREVLDVWEGRYVPPVIYEDGKNAKLIFDYYVLQKYEMKDLPKNAVIINEPQSYFEKNRQLILIFSGIVTVLIVLIVLLGLLLVGKNNLQSKNAELNRLNLNFIDIQKDIILRLGEIIETRSHETANHVKRVAQISKVLGEGYGLSEEEIRTLILISPMHDIGKIGISESILNKPGKLTDEEFEIMKRHSQIGYDILKNSDNEILWKAGILSLEHHERYDGTGYPRGVKGEHIHIFARITTVADVYDALRSVRVYKRAWTKEETEAYILEQKGKFFDPVIVDIFMNNIDTIHKIFDDLSDNG